MFPNQQPSAKKLHKLNETQQRELQDLIATSFTLTKQKVQLSRIIWALAKKLGPSAVVTETETPPLWNLRLEPLENGSMQIFAELLPELTAEQRTELINELRGTPKLLAEAVTKLKLPHPFDYLEKQIKDELVPHRWQWVHPEFAAANPVPLNEPPPPRAS